MSARKIAAFLCLGIVACTADAAVSNPPADPTPPPPTATVTDAGAVPQTRDTLIRIHYPTGKGSMAVYGSIAPLTNGAATVESTPGVFEAHVAAPADLPSFDIKPHLDTREAKGAFVHVKPGDTVDVYPHFLTNQGTVRALFTKFHSTAMEADPADNDQLIWAYLPPSYDENPLLRYPVLYMHDGQNLWEDAHSTTGVA